MSIQWDETHLCSRYNESDCEFFLKTDAEIVFNGKKLDKYCYYCTSENKVRKIDTGGTWTGLSPKFCPKRKTAEKEPAEKQPSCIDKSAVPKIGDYVSEDMLGELLTFDELTEMEGQLVVANYSTESKNWYKVVQVGKTVEQKPDGRRLLYRDNPKKKGFECSIGEWAFKSVTNVVQAEKMWRLKQPAEDKPAMTYLDKLREKYPKVNETDEWFDYCPAELFDGDDLPIVGDCPIKLECEDCWKSLCPADVDFKNDLEDFEADYFEQYPVEGTAEAAESVPEISEEKSETNKSLENQVATTTENALQSAFDYSELDSDTAEKLRAVSERVISIKATYIIETAKQVKAAHDLLANYKNGMFGLWCESVGFSRHTGTNLVHVAETFPDLDIVENFDNISPSLLYEASKPSAPPELVEQVKSGDITTHKDYIALKKQLEEANKRAETEQKARESISCNLDNMEKGYVEFKDKYTDEYYKNIELEKRVKELESRPIDVCVDHNEVTKRVTEAVNKINSETEKALAAREQEFAETLHFKDERIWELEDKLKELGAGGTDKKVYMVSMTEEDYQKMILELSGGLCKILSSAVVIDPYGKESGGNG